MVLSGDDAVSLVLDKVLQNDTSSGAVHADCENSVVVDDKNYFVVHLYTLTAPEEDGTQAASTLGWYSVDKATGRIYEYDLDEDKLVLVY